MSDECLLCCLVVPNLSSIASHVSSGYCKYDMSCRYQHHPHEFQQKPSSLLQLYGGASWKNGLLASQMVPVATLLAFQQQRSQQREQEQSQRVTQLERELIAMRQTVKQQRAHIEVVQRQQSLFQRKVVVIKKSRRVVRKSKPHGNREAEFIPRLQIGANVKCYEDAYAQALLPTPPRRQTLLPTPPAVANADDHHNGRGGHSYSKCDNDVPPHRYVRTKLTGQKRAFDQVDGLNTSSISVEVISDMHPTLSQSSPFTFRRHPPVPTHMHQPNNIDVDIPTTITRSPHSQT